MQGIRVSLLALLVLAGCAGDRAVLLPSPDGRKTAVVMSSRQGEQVLAAPYAAVLRGWGDAAITYGSSREDLEKRFGAALAAQPPRPQSFTVYFVEGRDELTAESLPELDKVKAVIRTWPSPEILVIGHTDRVGSVQSNDVLSLKRAQAVRAVLVAAGFPEKVMEVAGRGEREPLVPTADEVAEAKNRRVEITVR